MRPSIVTAGSHAGSSMDMASSHAHMHGGLAPGGGSSRDLYIPVSERQRWRTAAGGAMHGPNALNPSGADGSFYGAVDEGSSAEVGGGSAGAAAPPPPLLMSIGTDIDGGSFVGDVRDGGTPLSGTPRSGRFASDFPTPPGSYNDATAGPRLGHPSRSYPHSLSMDPLPEEPQFGGTDSHNNPTGASSGRLCNPIAAPVFTGMAAGGHGRSASMSNLSDGHSQGSIGNSNNRGSTRPPNPAANPLAYLRTTRSGERGTPPPPRQPPPPPPPSNCCFTVVFYHLSLQTDVILLRI